MNKKSLRKKYKALRIALAPQHLALFSEQITELILSHFQLEEKTISLFLPIERQKEINTYTLLERSMNIGARVSVPIADFDSHDLHHILYTNETTLKLNEWGIPEPISGETLSEKELDFVFVPLLAADKYGNRVGYGKGFYDRFLSKCSPHCVFIGLHLFDLESIIDDVLETDVRLHYIAMPDRIWKCAPLNG